jgi:hypothetical protein
VLPFEVLAHALDSTDLCLDSEDELLEFCMAHFAKSGDHRVFQFVFFERVTAKWMTKFCAVVPLDCLAELWDRLRPRLVLPLNAHEKVMQASQRHQISWTSFDSLLDYFEEHNYPLKCHGTHCLNSHVPQNAILRNCPQGFISWANKESWWRIELGRRVEITSYTMWRPQREPNTWYFEVCDGDPTINGNWIQPDTDGAPRGCRENFTFPSDEVTFRLPTPTCAQHIMIYHYAPTGTQGEGTPGEVLHLRHIDFSGRIQGDGTYLT